MALVKSKFKGKGKTGDKDNGQQKQQANAKTSPMDVDEPVCFECKEPMRLCGHSAKDCRVRKARVAAGGPERLPNGQRSSGKGSGTWPTRQMWSNFYPGRCRRSGKVGIHSHLSHLRRRAGSSICSSSLTSCRA